MAGTFSQIYIQVDFAVKGWQNLVHASFEDELFRYISGIVTNKKQKSLAVNGMPDHIHILVGLKPSMCISDLSATSKTIPPISLTIAVYRGENLAGRRDMAHFPIRNQIMEK